MLTEALNSVVALKETIEINPAKELDPTKVKNNQKLLKEVVDMFFFHIINSVSIMPVYVHFSFLLRYSAFSFKGS